MALGNSSNLRLSARAPLRRHRYPTCAVNSARVDLLARAQKPIPGRCERPATYGDDIE